MLPEAKKFPIDFVFAEPGETDRLAAASQAIEDDDPVARLAKEHGWPLLVGERKWVVELGSKAGQPLRVQVEETGGTGASGGILRFLLGLDLALLAPPEKLAEHLRRNVQMAHCGFGMGVSGDPNRLVLAATLLRETADDDEILAVLRSIAAGGEPIVSASLDSFDRSKYKVAPPSSQSGAWEDEILKRSLGGTGIAFERNGPRADTLVRLEGGRTQKVYLYFDRADAASGQVIQLMSVCGPARPEHFRMALGSNTTLAFATIGLARIGAEENLVVVRTQLASTADPEEVLVGISTLAQIGDRIESQLTGGHDTR